MISSIYVEMLSSLHVDRSSGHPKPHKVCLLLAVIDLIKEGGAPKNEFIINDELKAAFGVHFERLKKANDAEQIIQPFYHLHSSGFWHFKVQPGKQRAFDEMRSNGRTPSKRALFDLIEYAYLDDELYEYFKNALTRDTAIEAILENIEDLSDQYRRWLVNMGKSDRTANSYVGAIKGSISKWANDADISHQNLIAIQSYSTINDVAEKLAEYSVFMEKNTKGNNMYSCALNSYKDFLATTCQAQVTEDIEQIISDPSTDSTQKSMLVNTRVGQGKFREKLIKYWKGCAVTGYTSTQFLVASHIKPWRDANDNERLDQFNGILLLPNLDKAFDLGYISFSEKGELTTSKFIEAPEILGIEVNMKIDVVRQHQDYLAYHRECVFERKI